MIQETSRTMGLAFKKISRFIDSQKFTLTEIAFETPYGAINTTNTKKAQEAQAAKQAEDGTLDNDTPDGEDKLITINTFLNVVSLINQVESDGEKIMLNLLLLLIVTGFRFEEASSVAEDALERVKLTEKDAKHIAKKFNLPLYDLKINYLAMKGSPNKVHWVEPNAIPLVEAIFAAVKELTQPYREILRKQRSSGFTDFLPEAIKNIDNDLVELDVICEHLIVTADAGDSGRSDRAVARDKAKKVLLNLGALPDKEIPLGKRKFKFLYSKAKLNEAYKLLAKNKKLIKQGESFTRIRVHMNKSHPIAYDDMLFIMPEGFSSLTQNRIFKNIITDISIMPMGRFLGSNSGTSVFMKYDLLDEDGEYSVLKTHIPRHNVNTFLAIAGVTDHLQAVLMGRRDIKQNEHYQHLALAQKISPSSPEHFKGFDKPSVKHTKNDSPQLSLFDNFDSANGIDSNIENDCSDLDELFSGQLDEKQITNPVEHVKATGTMVFDSDLSLESNIKKSLHTYGSHEENARFLADALSENFMPDLTEVYKDLVQNGESKKAKELLERHSHLNALPLGTCTRNLGLWGCPFGAKCVTGQECGYHEMTGRSGELETIIEYSISAQNNLKQLEQLVQQDNSYADSLLKAKDACLSFDKMKSKSQEALAKGHLISLIENPTPEQFGEFRQPKTLADFFAIELRRMEKAKAQKDGKGEKEPKND
ncbi:hypothetical protein [Photobacterium leiognathi]|uniref:hypothetical protein n=1 Tax=Photobacterium leiognathi TaxID=553611 RepID=UPI002739D031|nr:hypothetical protein [Photobacterium leiognathi]